MVALVVQNARPRQRVGGLQQWPILAVTRAFVRGFGRRRPDACVTVLRLANMVGPRVDTGLTRYLSLPVVPTVLGFDPRVQLCHEDDGIEVLMRTTLEDHPGIFNVGGDGVLPLSQAVRRAGRVGVPIPGPAVSLVGSLFRSAGLVDFSPEQMRFLSHGRVVDTTRIKRELGWEPKYPDIESIIRTAWAWHSQHPKGYGRRP